MTKEKIIALAKKTILTQASSIAHLENLLTFDFSSAVEAIYNSKGRVVVTGIGKSAIIANKIVATLNSTGTPAIFMHAADAIHGDLGTILSNDIVICISKSGNTPEIKVLVPLIKNFKNTLVAITGNDTSYLAKQADYILNTFVEKEACPNNLAPTASTTAQLVMGDALAVCLLQMRGFSSEDFARYHPGGALGKTLYLKVKDITVQNMKPQVTPNSTIQEVIVVISENMLGATAVLENGQIIGVVTDGDIRRMLKKHTDFSGLTAADIMTKSPKTIANDALAIEAMEIMEKNDITQLLAEENGNYVGIVHIHNLVKEGII